MVEPTEFKEMLKGVTAIMVTPYTDEGEVSEERVALAGSPVGPVRLPVPKFDENEKEQLKKIIEDLGLID